MFPSKYSPSPPVPELLAWWLQGEAEGSPVHSRGENGSQTFFGSPSVFLISPPFLKVPCFKDASFPAFSLTDCCHCRVVPPSLWEGLPGYPISSLLSLAHQVKHKSLCGNFFIEQLCLSFPFLILFFIWTCRRLTIQASNGRTWLSESWLLIYSPAPAFRSV